MNLRTRLARLCWTLDAHRGVLLVANTTAALLFVLGCLAFYRQTLHATGVTLFLFGSIVWLASTLGDALLRYGPDE